MIKFATAGSQGAFSATGVSSGNAIAINEKDQVTGGGVTTPSALPSGHRPSLPGGVGPVMSSTPLPTATGASTAASMATNFFRRCTSITAPSTTDTNARLHTDLSETPTTALKTVNETSELETLTSQDVSRNEFEMKNLTNKKLINETKQGFSSKLPKPGKSRKNSRAPPPPQMSTVGKSRSRASKQSHEPVQRPCKTHSFHTDAAEVQHMEEGLLKLLDAFNSGKLRAFGQGCSMEQMESIRNQQESLAKLHFELGAKLDPFAPLSEEGLRVANENMDTLMNSLEKVSISIGELNPAASTPATPTTKKSERPPS